MRPIEDYGNRLSIVGFIVGNGEESETIYLSKSPLTPISVEFVPTTEELTAIFNQLDTLQITNSQKTVLRKSQRQIDQKIAWEVFKRDDYRCVYCGHDNLPLTVDHLVLWEEMGNTVAENLVSACKKCNHTRGNKSLTEFLKSDYYLSLNHSRRIDANTLIGYLVLAEKLPRRKPRSR